MPTNNLEYQRQYDKTPKRIEYLRTRRLELRRQRWHSDTEYRTRKTEQALASRRKIKYGITRDQYDALLKAQDNRCALCRQMEKHLTPKTCKPASLSVDHDHRTGKVRGLLCRACNIALAVAENRSWRIRVEKYLVKS